MTTNFITNKKIAEHATAFIKNQVAKTSQLLEQKQEWIGNYIEQMLQTNT